MTSGSTPVGFFLEDDKESITKIRVEAFYDLACPYSKKSWLNLKPVLTAFGPQIKYVLHLTALPFHYNAFLAAQAANVVLRLKGPGIFWKYIDVLFENQDLISNGRTQDASRNDVIAILAKLGSEVGVDSKDFLKGLETAEYTQQVFKDFQYSCLRGVVGTPRFIVNDFLSPQIDSNWSLSEWEKLLGTFGIKAHQP